MHKREIAQRIAFLEEQAAIAGSGIAKYGAREPNLVARTFDSVNNAITGKRDLISEVQSDSPFYLRGYIAIEKELDILNSRQTIEPFVNDLLVIDQRINLLEIDKKLERAEQLFNQTPVAAGKRFIASSVSVESTHFEHKSKRKLMLALALVLGGMVGVFFALIKNVMRGQKDS